MINWLWIFGVDLCVCIFDLVVNGVVEVVVNGDVDFGVCLIGLLELIMVFELFFDDWMVFVVLLDYCFVV